MNRETISLAQTSAFSSLIVDYINNESKLAAFYKYPFNISSFKQAIADKANEFIDRKLLVEVLKEQYSAQNINVESLHIDRLENPATFTVCTGHQLCLFTGPLYFIYKLITVINLSEELKKNYPAYNFVPAYWMASEDHDFEEINHIHLFGKKIEWNAEQAIGDERRIAGAIETKSILTLINELKPILGETLNAKELITLFEQAYLTNKNLADATRALVHSLFGKYGLLVIDANDHRFKKQITGIIKDDVLNNSNYKIIQSTIRQLNNFGYKSQVNPREINCFYLQNNCRKRIISVGTKLSDENTEVTLSQKIINEIENNPERFSPNVVLRPLYQQKILPNIAYVGGPGELSYWLEYKQMFEHHRVNFPVLVPRNFILFVDPKTTQQWKKLGFTTIDYFRDADTLAKEFVLKNSETRLSLEDEQKQIEEVYGKIVKQVEYIDATLKANVLAEQQKAINALKTIELKLIKAEKQKNENTTNQIKKIKEKLFPNGSLQERYDNFIPFYLLYGQGFIDTLKKELNPFENKMIVLSE